MPFLSLSQCGEGTSAVKGLEKIHNLTSSTNSTTEKAILMLTDGQILDDKEEREKVLYKLNWTGITLIAAGFDGDSSGAASADVKNLKLYTSDNNILVGTNAVQLGIDIVNKMEERGIICKDHGNLSCFKIA